MKKIPGGISAFFPAYNDGGTITSMVLTAILAMRELTDDYEVIVVNDGSSDYTQQVWMSWCTHARTARYSTCRQQRLWHGSAQRLCQCH